MNVSFLIDESDRQTGLLLHDINTWLHFYARSGWRMIEEDVDDDGDTTAQLTRLTVDFRDPLDAADFWRWRDISSRGRRS
jgi:hypothetical protein